MIKILTIIDCQTINTFYPEAVRCNESALDTVMAYTACRNGFINNATGQCVTKCPLGQYGVTTFNRRGTAEAAYCLACNSTCYECAPNGECASCKKGYYLDTGSTRRKSTGTCLKKSSTSGVTYTYYVNAYDGAVNTKNVDNITGTVSDSFNTIFDAIRKG